MELSKYLLTLFLIPTTLIAQEESFPKVSIRDTEVRIIESEKVENTHYEIQITLPDDYKNGDTSYPVLYYLDAFHWGGTVIETYRLLRAFGEIRPLILVGISYQGVTRGEEYLFRSRDLIPTIITEENTGEYDQNVPPASGGAAQFYAFIKEELKPLIRSNYRTQESGSGILGISLGTLFATYVMFQEPEEFDNYILGSPRYDRDNFMILQDEEKYFAKSKSLPVNIFLSVGTEDLEFILVSWIKLRDRLRSHNYKGMNLVVASFEGENHTSGIPMTISRGIRALYSNH